jgi:hypothetical protein
MINDNPKKQKNTTREAKVPPARYIWRSIESMHSGFTPTSSRPSEHWYAHLLLNYAVLL